MVKWSTSWYGNNWRASRSVFGLDRYRHIGRGGVFAFTFHLPLAQFLQDSFHLPAQLCIWGSFLAIFLLMVFLFAALGFVLNRFVKLVFLGGFNRLAGAIFGIVQGVVLLSMILLALSSSVPFVTLGESIFIGSRNLIGR